MERLISLNKLQGVFKKQTNRWQLWSPQAQCITCSYSQHRCDWTRALGNMPHGTGQFHKYVWNNKSSHMGKCVSSFCPRSNVCMWRSLKQQHVGHTVAFQQHPLLCRWEYFIVVMLFMLLIGVEGYSCTLREASGIASSSWSDINIKPSASNYLLDLAVSTEKSNPICTL